MDDSIIDLGHQRKHVRPGPPPNPLPVPPGPAESFQPLQGDVPGEEHVPLQDAGIPVQDGSIDGLTADLSELIGNDLETEDEAIPIQDAEELYSWYLDRAVDRSVIQPTTELRKLYQDSSFPDKTLNDTESTHHHATTSPWTDSSCCCIVKGMTTELHSECFYLDLLDHDMIEIYASQNEQLIQ